MKDAGENPSSSLHQGHIKAQMNAVSYTACKDILNRNCSDAPQEVYSSFLTQRWAN